jgi:hypothetical protein
MMFDAAFPQDGRTIYRWTLTGTHTGPGGTGRAVRISGFELWTIGEDGLIAESQRPLRHYRMATSAGERGKQRIIQAPGQKTNN